LRSRKQLEEAQACVDVGKENRQEIGDLPSSANPLADRVTVQYPAERGRIRLAQTSHSCRKETEVTKTTRELPWANSRLSKRPHLVALRVVNATTDFQIP
jgi:hypothetical protein